jgi:hypothetical protein
MMAADWRHLDDFSLDQLDPVIFVEDAGSCHAVVIMDGEVMARWLGCHWLRSPFYACARLA